MWTLADSHSARVKEAAETSHDGSQVYSGVADQTSGTSYNIDTSIVGSVDHGETTFQVPIRYAADAGNRTPLLVVTLTYEDTSRGSLRCESERSYFRSTDAERESTPVYCKAGLLELGQPARVVVSDL